MFFENDEIEEFKYHGYRAKYHLYDDEEYENMTVAVFENGYMLIPENMIDKFKKVTTVYKNVTYIESKCMYCGSKENGWRRQHNTIEIKEGN